MNIEEIKNQIEEEIKEGNKENYKKLHSFCIKIYRNMNKDKVSKWNKDYKEKKKNNTPTQDNKTKNNTSLEKNNTHRGKNNTSKNNKQIVSNTDKVSNTDPPTQQTEQLLDIFS